MSGPWERYAAPTVTEGPWTRFTSQPVPSQPAPGIGERIAMGAGDIVQGGRQLMANTLGAAGVQPTSPDAAAATLARMGLPPEMTARGVEGLRQTQAAGITGVTPERANADVAAREQAYQARRGPEAGFDWARVLGNVGAGLPIAAALPGAASLAGSVAAGATQGAALSALQPVTEGEFWNEKGTQTLTGAALGGAAGPVGYAVGRAIAPRIDPNVRAMREAGVTMTPGQIVGGQGRQIENAATSIPVLGGQISAAQRRSIESFNRATANRVLRPLGQTVPGDMPAGRDLIAEVGARVGQAYDDVLARVQPFGPDQRFASEIARARAAMPTTQSREAFDGILRREVIERLQAGALDGRTYKDVTSIIGLHAAGYRGSANQWERKAGDALLEVNKAFSRLLERTNPAQREALKKADTAYAGFLRMQQAAQKSGATEGIFTPAHLAQATREMDRSFRRSAFARGDALLQDFSDAAKGALPSNVPDSGTPMRTALMAALGGAGYGLGVPPAALMAGGATYGAYSPVGQNILNALLLANRPAPVAATGRALAQSGGVAGAALAPMLSNRPENPNERNR
jgi:hypothetical protein